MHSRSSAWVNVLLSSFAPGQVFLALLSRFPDERNKIEQMAKARLDKIGRVQEQLLDQQREQLRMDPSHARNAFCVGCTAQVP